jgi:pyruvate/2-oxoglutarate dehydrogenase complex dihydrolipoamide acyltransferase (E2) component
MDESSTATTAKLCKWKIKEGDDINAYDIVCEVETEHLTNWDGPDAHSTKLEVELQEDACVAKLLAREGDVVKAGQPIAILCDSDDPEAMQAALSAHIDRQQNVYTGKPQRLAMWQAYTMKVDAV